MQDDRFPRKIIAINPLGPTHEQSDMQSIVNAFNQACNEHNINSTTNATEEGRFLQAERRPQVYGPIRLLFNFLRIEIHNSPVLRQTPKLYFRGESEETRVMFYEFLSRQIRSARLPALFGDGESQTPVATQDELNASIIHNKHVLVFHLIYRMACFTLCRQSNGHEDGPRILRALHQFVNHMRTARRLQHRYTAVSRSVPTTFQTSSLDQVLLQWVPIFEETVDLMRILNSNKTLCNNLIKNIKRCNGRLQARLLVEIKRHPKHGDGALDQSAVSLAEREAKLSERAKHIRDGNLKFPEPNPRDASLASIPPSSRSDAIPFGNQQNYTSFVSDIILASEYNYKGKLKPIFPEHNTENHIRKLYSLLRVGRYLKQTVTLLGTSFESMGWFGICNNMFDFTVLRGWTEAYFNQSIDVFTNTPDWYNMHHRAMCNQISGPSQLAQLMVKISLFNNPEFLRRIAQYYNLRLTNLFNLQQHAPLIIGVLGNGLGNRPFLTDCQTWESTRILNGNGLGAQVPAGDQAPVATPVIVASPPPRHLNSSCTFNPPIINKLRDEIRANKAFDTINSPSDLDKILSFSLENRKEKKRLLFNAISEFKTEVSGKIQGLEKAPCRLYFCILFLINICCLNRGIVTGKLTTSLKLVSTELKKYSLLINYLGRNLEVLYSWANSTITDGHGKKDLAMANNSRLGELIPKITSDNTRYLAEALKIAVELECNIRAMCAKPDDGWSSVDHGHDQHYALREGQMNMHQWLRFTKLNVNKHTEYALPARTT